MTATLHREQYSSFFAFSSSDSDESETSWEEAWLGGVGGAGDGDEVTGAARGGGGEALEEEEEEAEEEEEEEERPGAGRAKGGLEGGGSLPALLEEGEEEEKGREEGRRKGLSGEEGSVTPDKGSDRKRETIMRDKYKTPDIKRDMKRFQVTANLGVDWCCCWHQGQDTRDKRRSHWSPH